MSNEAKIQQLFAEHDELRKAFENDASVYAWLKQCRLDRCTVEEALIGVIVYLAREKKQYFDEVVRYGARYGRLEKELK